MTRPNKRLQALPAGALIMTPSEHSRLTINEYESKRHASIEIKILLTNPLKADRYRHGPPDIPATGGSQLFA